MNDEETVALIAGGHTFGKTHGAGDADDHVGPEPEGAPAGGAGPGLAEHLRHRQGRRHDHQRPRGHLDRQADPVEQPLLRDPLRLRVGAHDEPRPARSSGSPRTPRRSSPDAHDPAKKHQPTMLTTDLSLRFDPAYEQISRRFLENPDEFALAFAKAWYKLLHRDMGPVSRFLGPWVAEPQLWQDPVPAVDHELVDDADIAALKAKVLDSGLSVSAAGLHRLGLRGELPRRPTSAAAPTAPGSAWSRSAAGRSTSPSSSARSLDTLEGVQREFNAPAGGAKISLADLIVLAGSRGRREGGAGRRRRGDRAVPPGPHRRHPGADRRRVVRGARAARRRVPQLPAAGREAPAGDAAASTAPTCST